jgi:hypothetical protein
MLAPLASVLARLAPWPTKQNAVPENNHQQLPPLAAPIPPPAATYSKLNTRATFLSLVLSLLVEASG